MVIQDIEEYRKTLERLEDVDDLKSLEEMRKTPFSSEDWTTFVKEYHPGVILWVGYILCYNTRG